MKDYYDKETCNPQTEKRDIPPPLAYLRDIPAQVEAGTGTGAAEGRGTEMKYNPTRKEEILTYIKLYISVRNFPPTIKEIAEALGVGTATVSHYLDALEKERRIERRFNAARAIKVL